MYSALSLANRYEMFEYDKKRTHVLTQHRIKQFYPLFDRLLMVNPELKLIVEWVEANVSARWSKSIRGYVLNLCRISYMSYLMNPQWSGNQSDYVFKYNYIIIQQYLQRTVKVLIENYGLENKHYALKIKTPALNKLSKLFAEKMFDDSIKMLKHYYKLYPDVTPTVHAQKILDNL